MNPYLKHLNKIEFVVTNACTGRCKHCSQGEHTSSGKSIDPVIAETVVRRIAEKYAIQTVMTFGGEPLLFPETVCKIHSAARNMGVPKRQVITNGFFSSDPKRICDVADQLAKCGVNDLLLSADAFHQETISLELIMYFAEQLKMRGISPKIQPAWLVSPKDENPYNRTTREILRKFHDMGYQENDGNVIFPQGNALNYLKEYFQSESPKNPYEEDPQNIRCISIDAEGNALDGNVYQKPILEIIENYKP